MQPLRCLACVRGISADKLSGTRPAGADEIYPRSAAPICSDYWCGRTGRGTALVRDMTPQAGRNQVDYGLFVLMIFHKNIGIILEGGPTYMDY